MTAPRSAAQRKVSKAMDSGIPSANADGDAAARRPCHRKLYYYLLAAVLDRRISAEIIASALTATCRFFNELLRQCRLKVERRPVRAAFFSPAAALKSTAQGPKSGFKQPRWGLERPSRPRFNASEPVSGLPKTEFPDRLLGQSAARPTCRRIQSRL